MSEQLFEELSDALDTAVGRWNEDNLERLLGIETISTLGSQTQTLRIKRLGGPPLYWATLTLGLASIGVGYSRNRRIEIGPQLFEDDDPQTGCLIMDGKRVRIAEAIRKVLTAIFETPGEPAT